MAQLLQCDRCEKTQPGRIPEATLQFYQLQGCGQGITNAPPKPTVEGWCEVRGKLLCAGCSKDLNEWLSPPKVAP